MRLLDRLLLPASLAAGVALGLGFTAAILSDRLPFGRVSSGPWVGWPDAGTAETDPYQRALYARDGRIPLAAAAGLRFLARTDDAGRPLEGRCIYTLGGPAPPAEAWSVTLLDPGGAVRPSPDPREGFTSAELVRATDGTATITIAPQARPGNWLPTRGAARFVLMLSLYDTPLGPTLAAGGPVPALPDLARTQCP